MLGAPRDWCATVGLDPDTGIGWAGGYVGVGVSTSNLAGRTLAEQIAGVATESARAALISKPARNWEPEPLRWLAVSVVLGLMRAGDRAAAQDRPSSWRDRLVARIGGR